MGEVHAFPATERRPTRIPVDAIVEFLDDLSEPVDIRTAYGADDRDVFVGVLLRSQASPKRIEALSRDIARAVGASIVSVRTVSDSCVELTVFHHCEHCGR